MNRHGSMNRAYRLIWSAAHGIWIPVAEKTHGRGKSSSRTLLAAAMSLGAGVALAGGPSGGQVTAGTGSITQSGALTTITQDSSRLSLTWTSFNIAPQQTVDFVQPSSSAIAVNRIFDTNGTQILGHLNANGQVFLINPNGVLFGPGAQINVGGLVASTLDLRQAGLDTDVRQFSGTSNASVINEGTITAAPGGYVALVASHVSNQGVISAQLGTVALAAGNAATLAFSDNSLVHLQVDQSVWRSVAQNGGLLRAEGGQVIMTAGARNALLASVVNNTGVIEARTVGTHEGTITLLAGMAAGTVEVGGTLDASAPEGGGGGFIETSAAQVEVAGNARVTTAAAMGLYGSWLIDPQDFTIAASGGDITGAALSTELATTPILVESSAGQTAGPGNINVNDAVTWSANTVLTLTASHNVNINANITATGDAAGLVINPNTTNGADAASGGTYSLQSGASITLSGATPSLSIAGQVYTVINTLGAAGSTTGTDLQGINGGLTGHYALGSNIDALPTLGWNASDGFTPIGTAATAFSGSFDGLGHTIGNLSINQTSDEVGLFGVVSAGGVIRNVGIVGGSVEGGSYNVGGLVGSNHGTISNSYTTVNVTGQTNGGGGVVGSNYGTVSNSHASGTVGIPDNAGGLAGINRGTISNSYATGAVSGAYDVGGLIGYSPGDASNVYATGAATGTANIGGLIGYNHGAVTYSYATGNAHGSGDSVGGLVGSNYGTVVASYATGVPTGSGGVGGLVGAVGGGGTVTDSYWDVTTSGQATSAGGTGLTTTQMQTASNFVGFNFTATPAAAGNNWVMVDADGTLNNAGGASGATFPMLASEYSINVTNAHQLQLMAMNLAASYTLGQDIDASATALAVTSGSSDIWSTSGGFIPIGGTNAEFTGSFDGMNHAISNLTINLPNTNDVGLFGYIGVGAAVKNVALLGGSVVGANFIGELAGENDGSIANSYATGPVTGLQVIGGLVGNNSGLIDSSYATGAVSGSSSVGGLIGFNISTVTNSHATGTVSGSSDIGGLIGSNYGGSIAGSYATGSVSGSGYRTGGLIGQNYGDPEVNPSSGAISNSYASGAVNGYLIVGGLVGFNTGNISGSHATGSVTANGYAGGLVGTNFETITSSYATGTVNGGYGNNVGGLVGRDGGAIDSSYATGAVSGGSYVGGLLGNVGTQGVLSVTNSYASGNVTGTTGVGGLIGLNTFAVSDSYATGDVSGTTHVGGLAGVNYGTISNSYAIGHVQGTNASGGLVGFNYGTATISNSYAMGSAVGGGGLVGDNEGSVTESFWNSDINAIGIVAGNTTGAAALTSAGMMTMANFSAAGWSISSIGGSGSVWRIYQGDTAPLLLSLMTPLTVTADNVVQTYGAVPITSLSGASYSVAGAATSGHLFNLNNAYSGVTNAGSYAPLLYSDQQGYDISYINAVLTLAPATLTATANGATRIYGQANPTLSGSITGFVGSDTLASVTTGTESFTTTAVVGSNVGSYAISLSGLTANNGNYVFSNATGNATAFHITPATLTYNASAASIHSGQTPQGLSGTLSGFVLTDSLANATAGTPIWATTASAGSAPGRYAIDGSGLTSRNYVFVQATANATALTVHAGNSTVVPPETVPSLTQTAVGTLEADLPASQTSITLAPPDLAADIEQEPGGDAGLEVAAAVVGSDAIAMDKRVVADAMIPSLRIVGGGVKLPGGLVDANAP